MNSILETSCLMGFIYRKEEIVDSYCIRVYESSNGASLFPIHSALW